MSGHDLVRGVRSAVTPPPKQVQRSNIVDLVIAAIALIAVGSFAYFGYATWFAPHAPRPQATPPVQTAGLAEPRPVWTAEDTSRCKAAARAEADAPLPVDAMLTNRAVTDGFGPMATMIECRITTKRARFCDPIEKAALIEMINDYLGRVDLIRLGMGVQGAPMAVLGEMFGGEVSAGSAVYDMEKDGTFAVMKVYHDRIAAGLRALGRDGIISAADFATFMGTGVPSSIAEIFEGLVSEREVCAQGVST